MPILLPTPSVPTAGQDWAGARSHLLLQVNAGEAVHLAHLLQRDFQLRAQQGGRTGLLWLSQDLLCLGAHFAQALLEVFQLQVDLLREGRGVTSGTQARKPRVQTSTLLPGKGECPCPGSRWEGRKHLGGQSTGASPAPLPGSRVLLPPQRRPQERQSASAAVLIAGQREVIPAGR